MILPKRLSTRRLRLVPVAVLGLFLVELRRGEVMFFVNFLLFVLERGKAERGRRFFFIPLS